MQARGREDDLPHESSSTIRWSVAVTSLIPLSAFASRKRLVQGLGNHACALPLNRASICHIDVTGAYGVFCSSFATLRLWICSSVSPGMHSIDYDGKLLAITPYIIYIGHFVAFLGDNSVYLSSHDVAFSRTRISSSGTSGISQHLNLCAATRMVTGDHPM